MTEDPLANPRKKNTWPQWTALGLVGLMAIVLLGGLGIWLTWALLGSARQVSRSQGAAPTPDVLLARARLASLPETATDVRVQDSPGLFTGTSWLRFTVDHDTLANWLTSSPSIQSQLPPTVTQPTTSPAGLPFPRTAPIGAPATSPADFPDTGQPPWFLPPPTSRSYEIPPDSQHHNWGEVHVDEETGTVYVEIIWS